MWYIAIINASFWLVVAIIDKDHYAAGFVAILSVLAEILRRVEK